MKIDEMIASLDQEIAKMTEARDMLRRINGDVVEAAKRGRPKGVATAAPAAKRTRNMSAEAKARIAEAQRKRWAAQKGETGGSAKKAGSKKSSAKKSSAKAAETEPAAE